MKTLLCLRSKLFRPKNLITLIFTFSLLTPLFASAVIYTPPTIDISGMKFEDLNNNGLKDQGEEGLSGWTINISRTEGETFTDSVVTDENGNYSFSDLAPAPYEVCETLKDGWNQTYPSENDGCHVIESENDVENVNFGNYQVPETLGSVTVCKIIIDSQENIIDGFNYHPTNFHVPGGSKLPSTNFHVPLSLGEDLIGSDGINDAECVTYCGLSLGDYYYKEESITPEPEEWEAPLYNDQFNSAVNNLDDFFEYSGELFDDDPSNDDNRNMNSDGHIVLSSQRPDRTLVILNQRKASQPMTIYSYKVVCEKEEYLPDWAISSSNPSEITESLILDFVSDSEGKCHLEPGWDFQWGFDGEAQKQPGDFIGPATTGWNSFDTSTGSTDPAQVEIYDLEGNTKIWVRENLKEGYIPFKGGTEDPVSAEMLCYKDGYKYDNYDYISLAQLGNDYYCVALNAPSLCTPDQTQSCDTGLLGICSEGTQTCNEQGEWGECIQNNQPQSENCEDGLDNDCDGLVDGNDPDCQNLTCNFKVDFIRYSNAGEGDLSNKVFVGTDTNPYNPGEWISLLETDSNLNEDVPGLAVQRYSDKIKIFLYGSHEPGSEEALEGLVTIEGGEFTGIENVSEDPFEGWNNGIGTFGAVSEDEAYFSEDNPATSSFISSVDIANDAYYIYYNCSAASENCTNGIDDDSDGLIDCNDPDCTCYTCNEDTRIGDISGNGVIDFQDSGIIYRISLGQLGITGDICCADVDNDGDIDEDDSTLVWENRDGVEEACFPRGYTCSIKEHCSNQKDDDCDGLIDCDDSDCIDNSDCLPTCDESSDNWNLLDMVDIGNGDSEAYHPILGWSQANLPGNYGGCGDGSCDYRQVLGEEGDNQCTEEEREATAVLHLGNNLANKLKIRHLDGISLLDSFDVFVNDTLVGHFEDDTQIETEIWRESEFDLSNYGFWQDLTVKLVATDEIWDQCPTYGQVSIDKIELYGCGTPFDSDTGSINVCKLIDEDGDLETTEDQSLSEDVWSFILMFDGSSTTQDIVNGCTTFDGLEAGSYTVFEEEKEGWTLINPQEGYYEVELCSGESIELIFVNAESSPGCTPDQTQSCDTGLLGICSEGTQTCNEQGEWGECIQNNQPQSENCEDGLDNDCDGLVDGNDPDCQESSPPATSGGGGGGVVPIYLTIFREKNEDVETETAIVTWFTSIPATSRVIYDTVSHSEIGPAPNYGYAFSTEEDTKKVTFHTVIIEGLIPGETYYWRAISASSPEVLGDELSFQTSGSQEEEEEEEETPGFPPAGGATGDQGTGSEGGDTAGDEGEGSQEEDKEDSQEPSDEGIGFEELEVEDEEEGITEKGAAGFLSALGGIRTNSLFCLLIIIILLLIIFFLLAKRRKKKEEVQKTEF